MINNLGKFTIIFYKLGDKVVKLNSLRNLMYFTLIKKNTKLTKYLDCTILIKVVAPTLIY